MREDESRTICHTPTPGKKPTSIPSWKYDLLRAAILKIVPAREPGYPAKDLPEAIREKLGSQKLKDLGSVSWHATTVRLDLEVQGELRRVSGAKPLHVVRS